jgi:hypothetical protein
MEGHIAMGRIDAQPTNPRHDQRRHSLGEPKEQDRATYSYVASYFLTPFADATVQPTEIPARNQKLILHEASPHAAFYDSPCTELAGLSSSHAQAACTFCGGLPNYPSHHSHGTCDRDIQTPPCVLQSSALTTDTHHNPQPIHDRQASLLYAFAAPSF